MKKYSVDVDITMSKSIEVEAESEEQALEYAEQLISTNPYGYTYDFSHYVSHEVISAEEVEED